MTATQPRLEDTGFEPFAVSDLDVEHVVRVAACLDVDAASVIDAGVLPVLWHWAFFLPTEPTAELGPDGHLHRRPEMADYPRRMFGAGRVQVLEPLTIGVPAERVSAVRSAAMKEGSTGKFWVVTVGHEISQGGSLCLTEEKDFLLRAPSRTPAPGADHDDEPDADWVESVTPDPALLFRFSAVTYNAHRIHYDRPYATEVEEYPDLVVHGPLTAILLARMAEQRSGRAIRGLGFRASAPLFVDRRVWLTGGRADGHAWMAAIRSDHAVAMTLDAGTGTVIDFADASPVANLGPVGVWAAGFGGMRNDTLADVAAELEQLGYGSVWFPESPAGEPFVKSALVLAATSTLVAGTGIANLWLRHALTMTATARALVEAFPARFLLGIGVSHSLMVDALLPEAYTKPVAVMRQYLDGMDVTMPGLDPSVKRPPRVLAALGDRMLALARDRADGAHPYLVTPEHTAHARDVLGAGKVLVPEQAVVLSTDRAVVLSRARAHLSIYLRLENYRNNWVRLGYDDADFADGGSERLCDALVAGGDEATVRARVAAHLDAGADHVVIQALGESLRTVPMDQLRVLAPRCASEPIAASVRAFKEAGSRADPSVNEVTRP